MDSERVRDHNMRPQKTWLFLLLGIVSWLVISVLMLLVHFTNIYFKALILFKSFKLEFDFIERLKEFLQIPIMIDLINPFVPLLNLLSYFSLDFGAIGVTCVGAVMYVNRD